MHGTFTTTMTAKDIVVEPGLARAYGIVFTAIRNKNSLSQAEFGNDFTHKMHSTTINSWENGKYANNLSFPDWESKKREYAEKGGISIEAMDGLAQQIDAKLGATKDRFPAIRFMQDTQQEIGKDIAGLLANAGLPIGEKEVNRRVQSALEATSAIQR